MYDKNRLAGLCALHKHIYNKTQGLTRRYHTHRQTHREDCIFTGKNKLMTKMLDA
jgi:hypothetical protein